MQVCIRNRSISIVCVVYLCIVLQNLTVLVILYEKLKMIANSSVTRCYNIPGGEMNVCGYDVCICIVYI